MGQSSNLMPTMLGLRGKTSTYFVRFMSMASHHDFDKRKFWEECNGGQLQVNGSCCGGPR